MVKCTGSQGAQTGTKLQGRILVILSFSAACEAEKEPMLTQERADILG